MNDLISRKWLMECVNEGWIKFDTEKDKNIYVHLVRDIAPSAQETHEERTETHACDLISRQAAINEIREIYEWHDNVTKERIIEHFERLPSAQPERKIGRWIYGENDGQDGWYCSECRCFVPWDYDYYGLDNIDFIKDFKTCPRCDARMISYTGM